MYFDGAVIQLYSNSIFLCEGRATLTSYTSSISAIGKDPALFQTDEFILLGNNSVGLYGDLYIEARERTHNSQYNAFYTAEPSVKFFTEGECDYVIEKTECSVGHNWTENDFDLPTDEINNSVYTFAMEDNYPKMGDYDMNDMVIRLNKRIFQKTDDNLITKVEFDFDLVALGATRKLGLALQLDEVNISDIASVNIEGSNFGTGFFDITNGLENGQQMPVIPMFDYGHAMFGVDQKTMVNTSKGSKKYDEKKILLTVEFSNPVNPEAIDIDKLNLFVAQNDGLYDMRTEIHLPGHAHSSKSAVTKETEDALDGYMWALLIPGEFRHPVEVRKITDAYPQFENWVLSNKQQNTDWYSHPVEQFVY